MNRRELLEQERVLLAGTIVLQRLQMRGHLCAFRRGLLPPIGTPAAWRPLATIAGAGLAAALILRRPDFGPRVALAFAVAKLGLRCWRAWRSARMQISGGPAGLTADGAGRRSQ